MPTATNIAGTSDTNNEDARSTSSTLVNGEHSRNENESNRVNDSGQQISTNAARHGFDILTEDEETISFLHYSEKRHDTNAKPNPSIRNVPLEWVRILKDYTFMN